MRVEHIGNATLVLADCMDVMRDMPDKAFDLAIVDPPYREQNKPTKKMRQKINGRMKDFGHKPTVEYFQDLFRVSKNQIIWGANNFIENLKSTNCFLFWYKRNPIENYSDGELAWTSFDSVARCIPIDHFGAHTADAGDIIHPTQKPVALYKWILSHYAKTSDTILDTHGGSGSSVIACLDMGYSITWIEKDKDYYNAALKRIKDFAAQTKLPMDDTPEPVEQRLGFEEAL